MLLCLLACFRGAWFCFPFRSAGALFLSFRGRAAYSLRLVLLLCLLRRAFPRPIDVVLCLALVVQFADPSSDHWKVSLSMGRVSSSLGSATCPRAYRVGLFAGWVRAASWTFLCLLLMVLPARFLGKPLLTSCVLLRGCEEPLAVPAVGNAGSKPWSSRLLTELVGVLSRLFALCELQGYALRLDRKPRRIEAAPSAARRF